MEAPTTSPLIGEDDRRFLLDLARSAISNRLADLPPPVSSPPSDLLLEQRGAFVTLKIDHVLRGCIGHVVGVSPLWKSVRDNAVAAAFEDPRFPPLTGDELSRTVIEISALTPLCPVSAEQVVVGRDGVLIECGAARGLLLPQVATEYGWDRETFLDHTCRKAGLEAGCWRRSDAILKVFSAQVFGEATDR